MPRIKTSHWHDGHAPGTELEVDNDELRRLVRDGRVAEVLAEAIAHPEPAGPPVPPNQAADEAAPADSEAEAAEPERTGRRRR